MTSSTRAPWTTFTDPEMHARIEAAVSRVFRHFEATAPGTPHQEKAQDGSDLAYLSYDRNATNGTAVTASSKVLRTRLGSR